jgi:hypothetical protein
MADEKWEEVKGESNMWIPENPSESIEGFIMAMGPGSYGLQATVKGEKQEWVTPSHQVLQSRLAGCKVGDYIKITFESVQLPTVKGQKPTKIYSVKRRI